MPSLVRGATRLARYGTSATPDRYTTCRDKAHRIGILDPHQITNNETPSNAPRQRALSLRPERLGRLYPERAPHRHDAGERTDARHDRQVSHDQHAVNSLRPVLNIRAD